MSSWPQADAMRSIDLELVGPMTPVEVLYDFEGPCIFTAHTAAETRVLAYLSEPLEDEGLLRFVVSTVSEATVSALKDGMVSVREALERGSLWLVDLGQDQVPRRAFAVRAEQLPEDALPAPSTMLWSHLEPALVIRLRGPELTPGRMPAAALAQAAEIGGTALKPVFEWAARALRQDTSGRPPEWLRSLYGLPAQRLAYGSLEVAFRSADPGERAQEVLPLEPDALTPEQIQERGWEAIREGLVWAVSDGAVPEADGDEDKWLAILEAMKRLAPGLTGPVTSIEVSGRVVGRVAEPFALSRASSRRIRGALTAIKKRHEVQLRVFVGRVRDLDLDRLTMIVRDEGAADIQMVLDGEQLLETAREAHYHELPVTVAARSVDKKTWTVVDLELTPEVDAG